MLDSHLELHNGNYLQMYNSVEDLPADNLKEYTRYVIIDSGIGSTVEDLNSHVFKAARFIQKEDTDKAIKTLDHLIQCMTFVMKRRSPKDMSFYCLIKTVNGGPVLKDLSEDAILRQMKILSKKGLTVGKIKRYLDDFKKKLESELEVFFPKTVDMSPAKELFVRLKRRTSLVLKQIIDGVDRSDQIFKIDEDILDLNPPSVYYGSEGLEVNYLKGFSETLMLLNQQNIFTSQSKLTGFDYYNGIELVKDQVKNSKK